MELSRETLDRFVDGELPPEEMQRVGEMLASHPDLNAYVQRQEHLRGELRARFLELDGALPQRLIDTVRSAPMSWQWRLRTLLKDLAVRWLVPASAALVLGLAIGLAVRPQNDLGANASGQLVARGALGRTLDTQLASAGTGHGPAQVGISFRNKAGWDCRTFTNGESAGLACHRAGTWIVEALVRQTPEDAGAAYRMAGSDIPDAVRRVVIANMDGAPFDAQAEARARDSGWSGR